MKPSLGAAHPKNAANSIAGTHVIFVLLLVVGYLFLYVPYSCAQAGNETTFAMPGDAVLALYDAAKAGDMAAVSAIFGKEGDELIHTGDEVSDRNIVQNFLRRYDEMHRVVVEPDGTVTLYIGADNWPFPISIVKNSSGAWYFDAESGKQEILYRRVGRNENDAIEICHALAEAQVEYKSALRSGESSKHYALKFVSDEGKENGLYWKSSDGEPSSPIGPLIADATSEGYAVKQGQPTPFHGYYYRILTTQGPSAKGGAKDYLVDGQLVRGFAFVAYPAQYRNSGVMTFIVNQDGTVYEKDLGSDTESAAASMTEFNPDKSWNPVDQ
ncbi:MAG TPA: DUF2950 domain-containing protein [Terriglobales bacterium]|nr:DUF2950 domain-containing protein [Terriglobales bacterium]